MLKKTVMPWFILIFPVILMGCTKKDAHYYKMNPEQIQKARENCSRDSGSISCQELVALQETVNLLVESLARDPQGFGKRILTLQEEITTLDKAVRAHPENLQLVTELDAKKAKLSEYLAIVKWQEAPEH